MMLFNNELKKKYLALYYNIDLAQLSIFDKFYFFLKDGNFVGLKNQIWDEIPFDDISKDFIDEVEKKLLDIGCRQLSFRIVPKYTNTNSDYKKIDLLLSSGYSMLAGLTNILEIEKSSEEMWTKLRKSYKSLINNESKKLSFVTIDKIETQESEKHFYNWIELYSDAIARGNRKLNDEMIEIQKQMVNTNKAFLALAYQDGALASGMMFDYIHEYAYYSLSATLPVFEQEKRAISHFLMWKSIGYMIDSNIKLLELGIMNYPNELLSQASSKSINISQFKKGFGGDFVPVFYMTKTFGD